MFEDVLSWFEFIFQNLCLSHFVLKPFKCTSPSPHVYLMSPSCPHHVPLVSSHVPLMSPSCPSCVPLMSLSCPLMSPLVPLMSLSYPLNSPSYPCLSPGAERCCGQVAKSRLLSQHGRVPEGRSTTLHHVGTPTGGSTGGPET